MKIFDIYGVRAVDSIEGVRVICDVLGVAMEPHDSSFWGQYFLLNRTNGGSFRLIENFDGEDWRQEEFKEYRWLLEVNNVEEQNEILARMLKLSPTILPLFRTEMENNRVRRYVWREGRFLLVADRCM